MLNCYSSGVADAPRRQRQLERVLYTGWLYQKIALDNLVSQDGKRISILSPGRRNELEGPDFKDAQVILDDRIVSGDVEIHVSNSDWYHHGHQHDPNYNNVVLHVVTTAPQSRPIVKQNGDSVPVLVLRQLEAIEAKKSYPCQDWSGIAAQKAIEVFQQYGELRFRRKGAALRSRLMLTDPEQLFYELLADGLGYSQNRTAFRQLARQLPIGNIYAMLKPLDPEDRLLTIETLLFGLAGFLTVSKHRKYIADSNYGKGLRQRWIALAKQHALEEIPAIEWHFAGIRPANHPTRRIAALAQIIAKCYPALPGQLWIAQMASLRSFKTVGSWIRAQYQQPGGIWQNHPLFKSSHYRTLIGRRRLNDLLSNTLFPFAWAIGILDEQPLLRDRVWRFAHQQERGEIPAMIRRFIQHISLDQRFLDSNLLLQGAIEYYQRFCELEICNLCGLEKYAFI